MFKVGFIILTIVGIALVLAIAFNGNLIQNKKRFIRTTSLIVVVWLIMFILCIIELFI